MEFASLPLRHDVLLKLLILIADLFGNRSPIYVSIPVTADPRTADTLSDLAIVRPLVSSEFRAKSTSILATLLRATRSAI